MKFNLNNEISAVVAQLMGSECDPVDVLRSFAAKVKADASSPVTRIEVLHTCSECGDDEVVCFRCKASEVLGDQLTLALPLLVPKMAELARQWAKERRARKRAADPGPRPGPRGASPGRQTF